MENVVYIIDEIYVICIMHTQPNSITNVDMLKKILLSNAKLILRIFILRKKNPEEKKKINIPKAKYSVWLNDIYVIILW